MRRTSNSPASACEGKHAFDSFALATQVAGRKRGDAKVAAYHCPYCSRWHVGGPKKAPKLTPAGKWKTGRGPRRLDFEVEV